MFRIQTFERECSHVINKTNIVKFVSAKQKYGILDKFKSNKVPDISDKDKNSIFDTTQNITDSSLSSDTTDSDDIKRFGRPAYNKMNPSDFYDLKVKAHKPALKNQYDYADVNSGLESTYPTLENRFKPWNELMSESAYVKAAVKQIQDCAVCPITGGKVEYFDPISGLPTHSSEDAYLKDENYIESNRPELLKLAVAYENDSISKREFPEYDLAQEQPQGQMISYKDWESWFYTRQFNSMETQFHIAQVSKFLTYPLTIASILSNNSPYLSSNKGGPITHEGLKSLSALRYSIFPRFRESTSVDEEDILQPDRALRIFIVGSKSEALLPIAVWKQINYCMPDIKIELHFIGPETLYDNKTNEYVSYEENHKGIQISPELKIFYHTNMFHVNHLQGDFFPYDPYLDVFFLFHPNVAADPESTKSWMYETMKGLLDTKCPVFVSGHSLDGFMEDWNMVLDRYNEQLDVLMEPTENVFGSTKWQINPFMPTYAFQSNMFLGGFRGKRYHAVKVDE
ncbi:hypothetical protein QEN19_003264 [Hanseniaspora menglaensis]